MPLTPHYTSKLASPNHGKKNCPNQIHFSQAIYVVYDVAIVHFKFPGCVKKKSEPHHPYSTVLEYDEHLI